MKIKRRLNIAYYYPGTVLFFFQSDKNKLKINLWSIGPGNILAQMYNGDYISKHVKNKYTSVSVSLIRHTMYSILRNFFLFCYKFQH